MNELMDNDNSPFRKRLNKIIKLVTQICIVINCLFIGSVSVKLSDRVSIPVCIYWRLIYFFIIFFWLLGFIWIFKVIYAWKNSSCRIINYCIGISGLCYSIIEIQLDNCMNNLIFVTIYCIILEICFVLKCSMLIDIYYFRKSRQIRNQFNDELILNERVEIAIA